MRAMQAQKMTNLFEVPKEAWGRYRIQRNKHRQFATNWPFSLYRRDQKQNQFDKLNR